MAKSFVHESLLQQRRPRSNLADNLKSTLLLGACNTGTMAHKAPPSPRSPSHPCNHNGQIKQVIQTFCIVTVVTRRLPFASYRLVAPSQRGLISLTLLRCCVSSSSHSAKNTAKCFQFAKACCSDTACRLRWRSVCIQECSLGESVGTPHIGTVLLGTANSYEYMHDFLADVPEPA